MAVSQNPDPPTRQRTGTRADCDAGGHAWTLVTEDGPGDIYRCRVCGALDQD